MEELAFLDSMDMVLKQLFSAVVCLLLHDSSLRISLWVSIFILFYVSIDMFFVLFLFGAFFFFVCEVICLLGGAGNRTLNLMHDLSLSYIPRKIFFLINS